MLRPLLRLFPMRFKNRIKDRIFEAVRDKNSTAYYGQFAEDALIQTYFKNKAWSQSKNTNIKKEGFYVDIGAYSPFALSNTFYFYKNGWRGITVDATPGVKKAFDLYRPGDINIHSAISNEEGYLKFYSWGNSGFNTLSEDEVNRAYSANKVNSPPEIIEVPTMRLSSLLDKYLPAGQKIDFISIDVEGKDYEVLQSNNWEKYRPEIIIIELHLSDFEQVVNSKIYQFLKIKKYQLLYWAQPSLIFNDTRANRR